MFFDDQESKGSVKFGVGMTAGKGRYHFIASFGESETFQQLCISNHKDIQGVSDKPVRWFDTESRAVQVLKDTKKACHKCLRTIESAELDLKQ